MVLEASIRDAVGKFDPPFGYADGFDEATGQYRKLIWAKNPPEQSSADAVLVRAAEALAQLSDSQEQTGGQNRSWGPGRADHGRQVPRHARTGRCPQPEVPTKPRRFYGSVEIDMVRPVKAFDAILNAIVMELQRTPGAKVKLTLEIEAEVAEGFNDADVGIVRDNAKQLKFKTEVNRFR